MYGRKGKNMYTHRRTLSVELENDGESKSRITPKQIDFVWDF